MVITTLKLSKENKKRLDHFKIHPRQPIDEVLDLLLIHCEEAERKGDLEVFRK